MNKQKIPVNIHDHYHAHVYFDKQTIDLANNISSNARDLFSLKVGRLHQKAIGPHPKWSFQITFSSSDFELFIPWLEKQRHGLSVLIHALTGDNLQDHTDYAYWLGNEISLNLGLFRKK